MRRGIAADPHLMEEVCDLTRQHTLEFEAPQQIGLRFIRLRQLPSFCGRQLSKQFRELPKLHKRCVWIVAKIPLGQGAKTGELHVMLGKDAEICGLDGRYLAAQHVPPPPCWIVFSASATTVARAVLWRDNLDGGQRQSG
jgi:hypothetical protein